TTDAALALARTDGGRLKQYLLSDVTNFNFNDTTYVSVSNGPMSCALSGNRIMIDRYDGDFTFYAPGVSEVFYRSQKIFVVIDGNGTITPDPVSAVTGTPPAHEVLRAKAFPNPFNPSTTILFELADRSNVIATIYDLSGRRVKDLWSGPLPRGINALRWEGTNDNGARVASGVYFLRLETAGAATTLKLVLVK
ncbi:MAG: T9SS type A sorting domain-containing protein, partial [Candidatus Latescibacterota bacterium]